MVRLSLIAVALAVATAPPCAAEKPNVVIVLVDDFGWGDPACYGNAMVETPNVDRLATEGVRFTQGYVAAPICSPSRCGIITGQFPARWKITSFLQTKAGNRECGMADSLDPKAPSLPRMLKGAGYATAHVGKWHLGGGRDVTDAPKFAEYGYDVGLGTYESPEPAAPLGLKTVPWGPQDTLEPQQVPRHERSRWMVDEALAFLKKNSGKPCFVNLWLDDTHTPYVPSDAQVNAVRVEGESEPKAKYKAVLAGLDAQVGRLLEGLKGTNTLVLFLGDNGASPPFERARNGGLRGQKLSLYEGGIRVPFVAWWPGKAKGGVVNEKTVIAGIDFVPTLATVCGAKLPEGYVADGEDMAAAIRGEARVRAKPLFWEYGRNATSFAYPKDATHRSPTLAVRDGDWKLLVNADGTGAELYDIPKDFGETKNLVADHPDVAKRLVDQVLAWRKSVPVNKSIIPAALLVALAARADAAEPAKRPPNVLVIVGDDMGYADVGAHGGKDIPTPHLDALAKSGVRFTNGYVSGPYCSPTRAGMLTGRYQQRFGHEFNPAAGPNQGLPVAETTMADRMKAAGYRTALVGKWHLGNSADRVPQKRGFDEFFGFLGGAHDYFNPAGVLRGSEPAGERGYLTDAFAREAVGFIDRHKSRPFFLYLAFNAVHTPMQADDARVKKFAGIADPLRRTYAAMTVAMDDAVGRVIGKLNEEKLADETLVVFISDNGGPTMKGTTINGSINAPLRGSKRTTLEGGVRVPFFMSFPGRVPAGVTDDRPVIQLDILPTALAAAGVEAKPEWKLDGVNLLPYLGAKKNEAAPHDALFWRMGNQMAVRRGEWKLVKYDLAAEGGAGTSAAKLYNLKDDLGEGTDLAAKQPEKVKEFQAAWDAWNKSNVAPLWGGGKAD